MKIPIFWNVTPCNLLDGSQRSEDYSASSFWLKSFNPTFLRKVGKHVPDGVTSYHIWDDDNGCDKSRILTQAVVMNFEALSWHSPRETRACPDSSLIRVSETCPRDICSSKHVCSLPVTPQGFNRHAIPNRILLLHYIVQSTA